MTSKKNPAYSAGFFFDNNEAIKPEHVGPYKRHPDVARNYWLSWKRYC